MAEARTSSGTTWAQAARDLARRVNRRRAWNAALRPIGIGLLGGAVLGLARRLMIAPDVAPQVNVPILLGAGLLAGFVVGIRAARGAPRTEIADAAWALDRLARANERGLTAAVVDGPAASEAAWAHPAVPSPPRVRLLPPAGLATTVAAVLLAAVAVLGPARTDASKAADASPSSGGTPAAAGGPAEAARAADAEAVRADARAAARERVRHALGLSRDGNVDPAELARTLDDPRARTKAREAAEGDDALAAALDDGHAAPEEIARALGGANDERERALQQRRAAVLARGRAALPPVPPHRRDVVARYQDLRRNAAERGHSVPNDASGATPRRPAMGDR